MRKEAQAEGIPIQQTIGLVLTDIVMPDMEGFYVKRKIYLYAYLIVVPVVIQYYLSVSAYLDIVRK
ncbi:chemotaxis protein CheV, partial [Erwinia amylovora]|nr:chemotaxis protein CheV [Erwinia amylovora]